MRKTKIIIVLMFLSFSSCQIDRRERQVLRNLIDESAVSIKNLESNQIVKDKFARLFSDKTIIGLGEATHGTDEFFKIRCDITKFLIAEMGYKTIAIEAGFQECNNLNKYICLGEGEPKELIKGLKQWFWQRERMLDFIEWLKVWNEKKGDENKVRIFGFDMQWRKESTEHVISYLSKVNQKFYKEYKNQLNIIKGLELIPLKADTFNVILDIKNDLVENRTTYLENSSEDQYKIILQNINVLLQTEPFLKDREGDRLTFEEIRERFMAENIEWIYKFNCGERMVIWGHNGHISKSDRCGLLNIICYDLMGRYLHNRFGELYYSIGFEFSKGIFLAYYNKEVFRPISLRSSPEGSLPEILEESNVDNCLIPMSAIKAVKIGNRFLNKTIKSHSIGTFYNEKHRYESIKIGEQYDALIFVEQSTIPKLID